MKCTPEHLKVFRKHFHITQARAGAAAGVNGATWGLWERGLRPIPDRVLPALRECIKYQKQKRRSIK